MRGRTFINKDATILDWPGTRVANRKGTSEGSPVSLPEITLSIKSAGRRTERRGRGAGLANFAASIEALSSTERSGQLLINPRRHRRSLMIGVDRMVKLNVYIH
jgi:hypothetical protein